jgi:ferredoxin
MREAMPQSGADDGTPEACDYTGACQAICPTEAISLTYEIVFHKKKKGGNS